MIVVNIFSKGGTFQHVRDAYVRLVDDRPGIHHDVELARYKLDSDIPTNGLIFASIARIRPEHGKLLVPCYAHAALQLSVSSMYLKLSLDLFRRRLES